MTRKDLFKAEIVAGRGQCRCIRGQGERCDRSPASLVADRQFGREMLGVGGTSSVAEEHQLAAAPD